MKHIVVSALVAAGVAGAVLVLFPRGLADNGEPSSVPGSPPMPSEDASPPLALSVTDALTEDVWIDGSRGPGDDHRILTSVENSVCFITKIDVRGISSPDDAYACSMEVDDFTGFWDLVVTVEEGSQASVRCNARCLSWE
jgi:hypothetical protein